MRYDIFSFFLFPSGYVIIMLRREIKLKLIGHSILQTCRLHLIHPIFSSSDMIPCSYDNILELTLQFGIMRTLSTNCICL